MRLKVKFKRLAQVGKNGGLQFFVVCLLVVLAAFVLPTRTVRSADDKSKSDPVFEKSVQKFFSDNCLACHSSDVATGGLDLEKYTSAASLTSDRATMEKIFGKLNSGSMPPAKMPRPKAEDLAAIEFWLTEHLKAPTVDAKPGSPTKLGRANEASPGRVTARRLNRTEYNNSVRDLLGINTYPADDFPQDDSGYGFDNIGDVLSLSPVLMEKYLTAAEKLSRTAVFGPPVQKPTLNRVRTGERSQPPIATPQTDYDQTGLSLPNAIHATYRFPVDGDYVIRANLGGERPAGSESLSITLWVDGKKVQEDKLDPAKLATFNSPGEPEELWSMNQQFRVNVTAGDHWVAVAIPKLFEGLPPTYGGPNPSTRPIPPLPKFRVFPGADPKDVEGLKKAFDERVNRKVPANGARVATLDIGGPYPVSNTKTEEENKALFKCSQASNNRGAVCAREVMARIARRAYRRPTTKAELDQLVTLVTDTQKDSGSFEEGLAVGVEAILLSPNFLFRIERSPESSKPGAHPISQYELATRLAYFLWSSLPDDELLKAAEKNQLRQPNLLEAQVKRMLRDRRADSLAQNFAGQWLEVRKLESVTPDRKRFPDFDDYLRRSMSTETELFFNSIVQDDRSVLDFIDADYTFLNERLARFYGIPNVVGPDFRKVTLTAASHRSGILTQGSVLTVSSYATRTSPVIRGKWVLANLLNSPPPPPPPDVPNLDEAKIGSTSSMREQLEQHRKNPICASCHSRMDPLGFGLENFNAIGQWRTKDGQFPVDSTGTLPSGKTFEGPQGLAHILKSQPDAFTEALTRKLMIYALGRGLESYDDAAVKKIVKDSAAADYRFSSIVLGVVKSAPFQMRQEESRQ